MIQLFVIALILIGLLFNSRRKMPKNFPPGPFPLPLLGCFHKINNNAPQKSIDDMYEKYGPCVGLSLGGFDVILVNGWKAVTEAFANEDLLGRPDVCLIRDRFDGDNYGVLFTDGEDWKTQRRFSLHHFRNLGFGRKSHEAVIQEEAEQLIEQIRGTSGKPFHLEEFTTVSIINLMWALVGGKRFDHKDQEIKVLCERIKDCIHDIKMFGSIAIGFPFLRYLFPKHTGYASIKRGSKGILEFVKKSIREHEQTRDPDNPRDFIDIYLEELQKPDVNPSFTEIQLSAICMDFLCAGGDTSTSVLSFAILFLCLRKDLQTKVFEEVMDNVGPNRYPNYEDKAKLVYTEAVLMEVLRMRPPGQTIIPHRALRDTTLMGFKVPKDTLLAMNVNSIFMDKQYWKNPETFRPERFITPEGAVRRDERLIPFGKGKRMCMGENLAKSSTFVLLASMIKNFSFSFDPNLPIPETEGVPGFTLAAPYFQIVATPRS